jgi:prevent-host-death family protein
VSVLRLTEVRDRLPELVAAVEARRSRVTVTRGGRAAAVLIAAEELRSLEETVAVLADPVLSGALLTAQRQVAAGQVTEAAELAAAMARRADRDRAG